MIGDASGSGDDFPPKDPGPRLAVFAGTRDGRELAARLAESPARVTLSVATEYGRALAGALPPSVRVLTGRLDQAALLEMFGREKYDAIIDATHPYALEVGRNLRFAAEAAGLPYFRLHRPESALADGCEVYPDAAAAAAALRDGEDAVLLAVGVKSLAAFTVVPNFAARFYPRVLPDVQSIRECERLGFAGRRIIAMQGPFSRELNVAIMRQYGIRVLVTKDGGSAGGMPEKVAAAGDIGARLLVIGRPGVEGERGMTAEEICAALAKL